MKSGKNETVKVGCAAPGSHNEHLCRLMEQGQTAAIQQVAGDAFVCANCGARAVSAEVLCRPEPTGAD